LKSFFWICLWLPCACFAQGNAVLPDSLLTRSDSLSIFMLLDSLMSSMENTPPTSQLAFRLGYNSNINATGSSFEFGQYGLSLGSTFYHKTGLYTDVSAYWSNENTPAYYLTTWSAGYINSQLRKWSFMIEFRKSFYRIDDEFVSPFPRITYNYIDNYSTGLYTNKLTSTVYFEHKIINLRFDYILLVESGTAHRFMPALSLNFEKRYWKGIDKISFFPTASWLYGIGPVPEYISLFRTRLQALYRIKNGLPLYKQIDSQKSGTLNYALTAPVSVSWKNWSIMASYTYNFPKTLPGETFIVSNGGYFTLSVVRYVDLKGKRKTSTD